MANKATYKTPTSRTGVRDWVTGSSDGQVSNQYTVIVYMTHSNLTRTRFGEVRLDVRMRVSELKSKLYTQCGTAPGSMQILLRDGERGRVLAELADENATLSFYKVRNGLTLHVVDTDPHSLSAHGALENVENVEKYVISDEAYNKRANTYRAFRDEKRKTDPTWAATRGTPPHPLDVNDAVTPSIAVGDRAEIAPGGRRASVKFIGKALEGLPAGWWVGVQYDEPVGKNDGSVRGTRYFTAPQGFGGFVRPSRVTVGDYPALDDLDEL